MGSSRMKPEAALHRAVAAYLRLVVRAPGTFTTIGHGGGGRVRGAQLKAAGVQRGWPDILVLYSDIDSAGHPVVLGLELKSPKGIQSADQKSVMASFLRNGAHYAVCRSLDDVKVALQDARIIA